MSDLAFIAFPTEEAALREALFPTQAKVETAQATVS